MAGVIEMSAPIAAIPPGDRAGGIRLGTWGETDAGAVHALLAEAYRDVGGTLAPSDEWLPWFTADEEFDATTCFLARGGGGLVGVCLCWASGFVKDLCVAPNARRRAGSSAAGPTGTRSRRAMSPRSDSTNGSASAGQAERYQPQVPGPPLKGPTTSGVIHPP